MHLACHVLGFEYYVLINPKVSSLFKQALNAPPRAGYAGFHVLSVVLGTIPYLSKKTVKFSGAYNAYWSTVVHGVKNTFLKQMKYSIGPGLARVLEETTLLKKKNNQGFG